MIRVLFMIAIAGFVLSVGTLAAAFAIGGPEAVARGGWVVAGKDWSGDWDWDWDDHDHHGRGARWSSDSGPQATRTLAWSGADKLDLDLAADVRYVQAAGPATVTVTGPRRAVDEVIVRGDSIRYDHRRAHWRPKLSIVVQAPNVTSFDLSGNNTLTIENYRQARLKLDLSGDAEATATGETDLIELDISGSGDVDLGSLKAKGANVDVSGAADAVIAPTDWARLDISGSGDVRLLTNPAKLETDVSGSGKVRQDGPSTGPSPSPSASPSPSPKAPKP
ncbi:MAG: DUF2807 domain-containing protein [Phenylobacterium sp.]|uniref:GIN domain-containing protein n=1 Tax=Phenylobacterium sp. TaxID=1871053 RepID=UPI00121CB96E|nr:DUF2807 domain-containing protein [Phenylobacterium sp.]TAJ73154.1 MAG: DUF2807 domain-containing protein [Phenylobacterium sp.]